MVVLCGGGGDATSGAGGAGGAGKTTISVDFFFIIIIFFFFFPHFSPPPASAPNPGRAHGARLLLHLCRVEFARHGECGQERRRGVAARARLDGRITAVPDNIEELRAGAADALPPVAPAPEAATFGGRHDAELDRRVHHFELVVPADRCDERSLRGDQGGGRRALGVSI